MSFQRHKRQNIENQHQIGIQLQFYLTPNVHNQKVRIKAVLQHWTYEPDEDGGSTEQLIKMEVESSRASECPGAQAAVKRATTALYMTHYQTQPSLPTGEFDLCNKYISFFKLINQTPSRYFPLPLNICYFNALSIYRLTMSITVHIF